MMENLKDYQSAVQCLRIAMGILCVWGVILSCYAYHVETSKEKDENYTAMCDISEHISCTSVFTSKYGKGFGLLEHIVGKDSILNQPNSVYGIIFYLGFIPLGEISSLTTARILILIALLSNICSIYLGCILLFVLHDLCLVCITTYIINAFLLVCSIFRFRLHKLMIGDEEIKKAT